jgi:hypothetical protein
MPVCRNPRLRIARAQSVVQFCIQDKSPGIAETHLSPVFSIETQAIPLRKLASKGFCQGFDDSVNFLADLCAVPYPAVSATLSQLLA